MRKTNQTNKQIKIQIKQIKIQTDTKTFRKLYEIVI